MNNFYETKIPNTIVDVLLQLLQGLKETGLGVEHETASRNAFQSRDLSSFPLLKPLLQQVIENIPESNLLTHRWFHLIDYNQGGYQEPHDHKMTEKYSYIIYLTDCENGGETFFKVKDEIIKIKPEKNKLIFFPADIIHWGSETVDKKKVAVGALILKDEIDL